MGAGRIKMEEDKMYKAGDVYYKQTEQLMNIRRAYDQVNPRNS